MSNSLLSDSKSLLVDATEAGILNSRLGLGDFAPGLKSINEYMPDPVNHGAQQIIADYSRAQVNISNAVEEDRKTSYNSMLAEKKRRELEEAARLKSLAQYRKSDLVKNADGSLHTDGALELRVKQGVNGLIGLWNSANDFIPDALVKDDTLDIGWAPTATIRGMAHEDLRNKDVNQIINNVYTKKDVLAEASAMKDDPTGQGTLYYGRKNIGTAENPEYIYKPGFATLNFADRYREQARASGWEIVREVQSSGSAELEKKIQTAFIDDRLLSAGQVKGKDGKYQNHDKASGIDFGSGYSEIYKKDILGWDKKPTKGELNKFKVGALKQASKDGVTGDQLKAYRATLDTITPDQLHQMNLDNNKARSYAKRDERDVYRSDHYSDGAYAAAASGLNRFGRELMDAGLDAIAVEGMDQNSALGAYLQSDGKGNSERLDKWKSQEEADKYTHYDRKKADEFGNALAYDINKGDYFSAVGQVFTQGGLNMTAESLGYQAPMLVGAILGTALTGGSGAAAGAVGYGSKIKTALGMATEAKAAMNTAQVVGRTAEAAAHAEKITAANAIINSGARSLASKAESLGNILKHGGFSAQVAAQSNERIDARIANNGGQPTSMLENLGVVAEGTIELLVDRAVDLATLGMGGYKDVQNVYKLLDDAAKANIATKIAAKAVALTGSAGMEGATEYVQYWGQALSEQYDTKKNAGTIAGIFNSKENHEEAITNLLMGAAAGVHMQVVPSGIGLAKDGVVAGINKFSGKTARDKMVRDQAELQGQVLGGTANPHSNTKSFTGTTAQSARADINWIATEAGMAPTQIATQMIREANGIQSDSDSTTMINNVNQSLKNAYNIGENGQSSDVAETSAYNHALYTSAISTIRSIVKFNSDPKNVTAADGTTKKLETADALAKVVESYRAILPERSMEMLELNISREILDNLRSKTIGDNLDVNVDDKSIEALYKTGSEGNSADIASLEEAFKNMNSLMGSMSSTPPGGGGGIKGSLAEIAAAIQSKIDEAKLSPDTKITPEFFDHLKSFKQVGNEILFQGRRKSDGEMNGKGIYVHAEDAIRDILSVQRSQTGKSKLNMGGISGFSSFATGRVKMKPFGSFEEGKVYTRSQVWHTSTDGKTNVKFGTNYVPEMEFDGKTTKSKISEAKHTIFAAEQVLAVLFDSDKLTESDKATAIASMNGVIEKQNADIVVLEAQLAKILEARKTTGSLIFVNLRNQRAGNPEVAKLLKQADEMKNRNGRPMFGPNDPVYGYVESNGNIVESSYYDESDIGSESDTADNSSGSEKPEGSSSEVDDLAEEYGIDTSKPKDEKPKAKKSDNSGEQSDYAEAKDGSVSDYKKQQEEGNGNEQERSKERSDEQGSAGEASSETATSAKDSQDDQSGTKSNQKADGSREKPRVEDAGVETPSSFNSKLFEAEKEALAALQEESENIINDIVSENGLDYKYNPDLSLGDNLKELRKAITVVVNGYKTSVKIAIKESFGKIDKLAVLLTAAVKGEVIAGISSNPDIAKAKDLNDQKKFASLSGDQTAKENSHKTKRIAALRKSIDQAIVDGDLTKQWKHMVSLAKLLGIPLPANKPKRKASGAADAKSDVENDIYSEFKENQAPTKEEVAELERLFEEDKKNESDTVEPHENEEENHVPDIDQDGIDAIVDEAQNQLDMEKKAKEASDAKLNIFSAGDGITAIVKYDEINAKIAKIKEDIKAKRDVRFAEIVKELKSAAIAEGNGSILTKEQLSSINKEANKQLNNEMENC